MSNNALDRRGFLGAAALSVATMRRSTISADTHAIEGVSSSPRSAARANVLTDVKQINAGLLNVGYVDAGPRDGRVVMLLHGWPYDIQSYGDVVPLLTARGYRVIVPHLRGYGTTHFLAASTLRTGEQSAFADDIVELMDALHIKQAVMGGFDWGSRTAAVLGALWPERCKALVCVSGYLIVNLEANQQPLPPRAELGWWYQYYFATERGRHGYDANRHEFNKLIWKSASPSWKFDDATFDRTAASFANPDHTAIVIHNYRWRLKLADGAPVYDPFEHKLAGAPNVTVPTITIASDFDGAAADGAAYAHKFSGRYAHRILKGIGHNVPQEAPRAFADAVIDVDRF
jgi:pimeloyl-ACP methyl ester carboxylesterase